MQLLNVEEKVNISAWVEGKYLRKCTISSDLILFRRSWSFFIWVISNNWKSDVGWSSSISCWLYEANICYRRGVGGRKWPFQFISLDITGHKNLAWSHNTPAYILVTIHNMFVLGTLCVLFTLKICINLFYDNKILVYMNHFHGNKDWNHFTTLVIPSDKVILTI